MSKYICGSGSRKSYMLSIKFFVFVAGKKIMDKLSINLRCLLVFLCFHIFAVVTITIAVTNYPIFKVPYIFISYAKALNKSE